MADNENSKRTIPETPAPTRSQTNLASRPPNIEKQSVDEASRGIPQSAAKPPPDAFVLKDRRGGEAGLVAEETAESSAWMETVAPEAAAEPATLSNLRKIGAECLLMAICFLTGSVTQNRHARAVPLPHRAATPVARPEISRGETARGLPDDAGAAFTNAIEDLDSAVGDFPQQSPQEILKTVSSSGRDCRLLWNGDYPSVLFGRTPIGTNSLAANLEGCAQAVRHLHR